MRINNHQNICSRASFLSKNSDIFKNIYFTVQCDPNRKATQQTLCMYCSESLHQGNKTMIWFDMKLETNKSSSESCG